MTVYQGNFPSRESTKIHWEPIGVSKKTIRGIQPIQRRPEESGPWGGIGRLMDSGGMGHVCVDFIAYNIHIKYINIYILCTFYMCRKKTCIYIYIYTHTRTVYCILAVLQFTTTTTTTTTTIIIIIIMIMIMIMYLKRSCAALIDGIQQKVALAGDMASLGRLFL